MGIAVGFLIPLIPYKEAQVCSDDITLGHACEAARLDQVCLPAKLSATLPPSVYDFVVFLQV